MALLRDDRTIVSDGYAVAYNGTDPIATIGATLNVTYQAGESGTETQLSLSYGGTAGQNPIYTAEGTNSMTGEEETYYLLPLPGEVVNTAYAPEDFFQTITIADLRATVAPKSYY